MLNMGVVIPHHQFTLKPNPIDYRPANPRSENFKDMDALFLWSPQNCKITLRNPTFCWLGIVIVRAPQNTRIEKLPLLRPETYK
jgi:hypothetical protein